MVLVCKAAHFGFKVGDRFNGFIHKSFKKNKPYEFYVTISDQICYYNLFSFLQAWEIVEVLFGDSILENNWRYERNTYECIIDEQYREIIRVSYQGGDKWLILSLGSSFILYEYKLERIKSVIMIAEIYYSYLVANLNKLIKR